MITESTEKRQLQPADAAERAALACLLRLRSLGTSREEIAQDLVAETGLVLTVEAVDRVLEEIAGPVPRDESGDPAYFAGHLGGG
jgi:hypothetical protein